MNARVLVVAKAPVPGLAKTRLGGRLGMARAADLAAAALLDTLDACSAGYPPGRRLLALEGDLRAAARSGEIDTALEGWAVFPQRGRGLDERLAHAHADSRFLGAGPVVQIGMDTPHVRPDQLTAVANGLERADAVLGPASDGGWWALGLREPRDAQALVGVPMSTPDTGHRTRAALERAGLSVGTTEELDDVDTEDDATQVARLYDGRFARAWAHHAEPVRRQEAAT